MKTSTITFSAITLLLLIVIGFGAWTLSNQPGEHNQQKAQDSSSEQMIKEYTIDEVATHSTRDDCWTIISGEVYDLSEFINRHPGGNEILQACGIDATSLFESRETTDGQPIGSGTPHSPVAREQLSQLKIGTLVTQ